MALYLTRFSYTPETWARMTKNPEDRREAARPRALLDRLRGSNADERYLASSTDAQARDCCIPRQVSAR